MSADAMVTPEQPVADTTLVAIVRTMLAGGAVDDALRTWYVARPCGCSPSPGWTTTALLPGLVVSWCGTCGRPSAADQARHHGWTKGDVAVYDDRLVQLEGAPGPTGGVRLLILEGNTGDPDTLSAHVAQLNLGE